MARVSNWNPQRFDGEFMHASMDRVRKAANVLADAARRNCPVGTVSRPIYRRGPYAGQPWTAMVDAETPCSSARRSAVLSNTGSF